MCKQKALKAQLQECGITANLIMEVYTWDIIFLGDWGRFSPQRIREAEVGRDLFFLRSAVKYYRISMPASLKACSLSSSGELVMIACSEVAGQI